MLCSFGKLFPGGIVPCLEERSRFCIATLVERLLLLRSNRKISCFDVKRVNKDGAFLRGGVVDVHLIVRIDECFQNGRCKCKCV